MIRLVLIKIIIYKEYQKIKLFYLLLLKNVLFLMRMKYIWHKKVVKIFFYASQNILLFMTLKQSREIYAI